MPPSWYQSPPASSMPVAGETIPRQNPAVIRKSGLEIKNQCTKEGVNGEKLASIPKSGPEIKNQCTKDGGNRENPVSIRKFGLEIKNRCTKQPIFSTLPQQIPQHIPQHAFRHALTTRLALDVCMGRARAGSTVAAKAGADAPGGGISLCFCRRGCTAPAQKAATLNASSLQHPPRSTTLAAAPAQQNFTLIHSAVFHLIAVGVILLALTNRRLGKRYSYDSSPVNAS